MYWTPGPDNSSLISTENAVPNRPENNANIRYKVPISFALLDKNQRSHQRDILFWFKFKFLSSLFVWLIKVMKIKINMS
jgi:hypothetical protein